jgi:hypothetical protein
VADDFLLLPHARIGDDAAEHAYWSERYPGF